MKRVLILMVAGLFCINAFGQQASPYRIEKIEYKNKAGDWEGCSFNLTIDSNKTVEYIADSLYCKPLLGKHQSIDKEYYDTLIGMLNKSKFQKLKDSYGEGVDVGIDVLTVTYNTGKTKKIIVIGGNNEPKALKDILHLLHSLKDTEHWK